MIPVTTPFLPRLTILRSLLKRLPRPSTEGQQGANREGQGDLPREVMCPTHPMMSTKRGGISLDLTLWAAPHNTYANIPHHSVILASMQLKYFVTFHWSQLTQNWNPNCFYNICLIVSTNFLSYIFIPVMKSVVE